MSKTYNSISFEANRKHACTLDRFFAGKRPCIFRHSALRFILITWFTYAFANVCGMTKWVQFAGCSLDLVI